MAAPQPTRRGPLAGLRVLELAGIGPGPFCAMLLADLIGIVTAILLSYLFFGSAH